MLLCKDEDLSNKFCGRLDKFSKHPVIDVNMLANNIYMGILKAAEVIPQIEKDHDVKSLRFEQFLNSSNCLSFFVYQRNGEVHQ